MTRPASYKGLTIAQPQQYDADGNLLVGELKSPSGVTPYANQPGVTTDSDPLTPGLSGQPQPAGAKYAATPGEVPEHQEHDRE